MNDRLPADLLEIRRFLVRLTRRERAAIALDVLGRLAIVLFCALFVLVLAASFGWDRGASTSALVMVVGVGVWAAVALPLLTRWPASGDALRQARLAEAEAPDLRGRLVTLVEREVRGPGAESELMVGLTARRALEALPTGREARIHQMFREAAVLAGASVLVLAALVSSLLAGGPFAVVRWWAAGFDASAAMAALQLDGGEDHVQVGDLVLRYVYPEYTGLEPRVVENSTGDAQGPPGTVVQISARSAEPVEAAGLVVQDQRFEAQVVGERQVEGSFSIGPTAGTYHLLTWRRGESRRSRDFQITPLDDLAPEVMLDGPEDVVELAVDELLSLDWRARDDYGVASVELRLDGRASGAPLYRATERRAEVFEHLAVTPGALNLQPGQTVVLEIAATDADTIGGAKVGVSRPVKLVVLGAKGLSQRDDRRMKELVELMLTALAEHLEDTEAATVVSGQIVSWGEKVAGRYEPLQGIVDREWDRLPSDGLEAVALGEVVRTGGELVRYTQVAFEPRSTERASREALADVRRLWDAAVVALEDGILSLDRALRLSALQDVVDVAERMDRIGEELDQMMAGDADALEMLAKLEQLEAMLNDLRDAAAKLDEGGLKEFLNARSNELGDLMSEIRKAITEGRKDDAKKLMERLAEQLQQLAEGVRDTQARQQQEGDQTMDKAEELKKELERLENEQRALQAEVAELREQEDAASTERDQQAWQAIDREIGELNESLQAYLDELIDADRPFNEVQRTEAAQESGARLRDAAAARDFRATRGSLLATESGVDAMYRGNQATRFIRRDVDGPGEAELEVLDAHLRRIAELLERMEQQQGSPQSQQRAQELQSKQQQLEQQLEQAGEQAGELMQEMPVRPKDLEDRMGEAQRRMGEASDDLGQGRPMPAEGSQGAAADRIREARDSLDQAMKQAQQQQSGGSSGSSGSSGGDGSEDGGSDPHGPPPDIEIPGAEEFRTPEEYRRALLEGMQGEVPEEFQALKKRYFEELVRQ